MPFKCYFTPILPPNKYTVVYVLGHSIWFTFYTFKSHFNATINAKMVVHLCFWSISLKLMPWSMKLH